MPIKTHLSVFSGSGAESLACESFGIETVAFIEKNGILINFLRQKFGKKIYEDITRDLHQIIQDHGGRIDLVTGGDPCPIRSRARGGRETKHPDLSGYYLALVGGIRPRWVVRENVPAPDDKWFCAALETIGYRSVVIRTDASSFTAQQRIRDFIVAASFEAWDSLESLVSRFEDGLRGSAPRLSTRPVVACFTANKHRYDSRDNFIFEEGRGLRLLSRCEQEALAGFPENWFAGLSETAVAKAVGNAVVPAVLKKIIFNILESDQEIQKS